MVPATLLLQALEVLASTLCYGMELVEVSVAPGAERQQLLQLLLQLLLPSAYCVLGVLVLMAALAACRPACTVLSVTHMTHVHDPSACSFIAVSPHAAAVLLRCRSMSGSPAAWTHRLAKAGLLPQLPQGHAGRGPAAPAGPAAGAAAGTGPNPPRQDRGVVRHHKAGYANTALSCLR
jgi:hypothetical protein